MSIVFVMRTDSPGTYLPPPPPNLGVYCNLCVCIYWGWGGGYIATPVSVFTWEGAILQPMCLYLRGGGGGGGVLQLLHLYLPWGGGGGILQPMCLYLLGGLSQLQCLYLPEVGGEGRVILQPMCLHVYLVCSPWSCLTSRVSLCVLWQIQSYNFMANTLWWSWASVCVCVFQLIKTL